MVSVVVFALLAVSTAALPRHNHDAVITKFGGERYQHVRSADGTVHLVDTWAKISDLEEAARFNPDTENVYHLFTRQNPSVSQPLLLGATSLLTASNYSPARRTIVIVHGWKDNVQGNFNRVIIPAFLEADDVNVISVDWSAGGGTLNYIAAVINTVTSGVSVARFINWLNQVSGSTPAQYHIVGFSLGGHQAGIIGRNVNGDVAYITSLDPAMPGWVTNDNKFRATDGSYTEVLHTDAGVSGYLSPLGQVDFYPNGGRNMPGCGISPECNHFRCYYYFAESLGAGVFTGTRCASYFDALLGNCSLEDTLVMGGLRPKPGSFGIFYLQTNAGPPFSQA